MVHAAFDEIAHRPWPVPAGPWAMAMSWHDLLFAHWPVTPEAIRALVPPCLELDLFDGRAWVGVVPFRMSGVRLRLLFPMPGCGAFPELNLRTYVRARADSEEGRRAGVFFWSLDAASAIAVRAARTWFHLPYFDAAMSCTADGAGISYTSRRTHRGAPAAEFVARYEPFGPVFRAAPGTFERWLTERYCLYAVDGRGRAHRGDIHHAPWPLQQAHAEIRTNTIGAAAGITLPRAEPHLLFARTLDVVAWRPTRVQ